MRKTRNTPLHPQSDGLVEKQHRSILEYVAKFVADNQKDWDRWIPLFLLAYRSSKQEAVGVTPAEMYLGQNLRLPLNLLRGSPSSDIREEKPRSYIVKLKRKLDEIHHGARRRLEVRSRNMKAWYDRRVRKNLFETGQKVWFYNPRRTKGKAPKLQCSWEGPYEVVGKLSDVVFGIRKSPRHRRKVVHADRLAPYRERHVVFSEWQLIRKERRTRSASVEMAIAAALLTVFRRGFPVRRRANARAEDSGLLREEVGTPEVPPESEDSGPRKVRSIDEHRREIGGRANDGRSVSKRQETTARSCAR
ncbi:hypothetical protein DMN91_010983 [Ooceraea biroi]|uniref:Integrase catalytic domain-containing protein n=1 Tax=Ooceraea biroi TaxID=2015173 RepID=A0A3L8D999_OOCBI|nr:hypothetical protein DMN91_010983 [Ooceraea biroi]